MSDDGATRLEGELLGSPARAGYGAEAPRPSRGVAPAGRPAEGPPPPGTTGVEIVAAVHWLALTVHGAGVEWVSGLAAAVLGVKTATFERMAYGAHGYRVQLQGVQGVKIYAGPVDGGDHVHLVVPGGACEILGTEGLIELLDGIRRRGFEFRATRVDLALDGGEFTPEDCLRAWEGDQVRCATRRDTYGVLRNREGVMVTLGARSSERYARVYNRRGPTRFELECKGDRAAAIVGQLLDTRLERWPDVIRAHIRDYAEFEAPWWDALLGGVARAALKLGTVAQRTFDSTRAWIVKQVAPSLAALVDHEGGSFDFVSELLRDGRRRYRPVHRLIAQGVYA